MPPRVRNSPAAAAAAAVAAAAEAARIRNAASLSSSGAAAVQPPPLVQSAPAAAPAEVDDDIIDNNTLQKKGSTMTKLTLKSLKEDYRYWLRVIMHYLDLAKLADVVKDAEVSQLIKRDWATAARFPTLTMVERREMEENERISQKDKIKKAKNAHFFIMMTIDPSLYASLENLHAEHDAFDLLNCVEKRFSPVSDITSFQAHLNLVQARRKPNEDIFDFKNRIIGLADEKQKLPKNPDTEKNLVLYLSLTEEERKVVDPELMKNEKVTFDRLIDNIHQADEFRGVIQNNGSNGGKRGNVALYASVVQKLGKRPNMSKPDVSCYTCGVKGHYASKCPQGVANKAKRPKTDRHKNGKKKSGMFCVNCKKFNHNVDTCNFLRAKFAKEAKEAKEGKESSEEVTAPAESKESSEKSSGSEDGKKGRKQFLSVVKPV